MPLLGFRMAKLLLLLFSLQALTNTANAFYQCDPNIENDFACDSNTLKNDSDLHSECNGAANVRLFCTAFLDYDPSKGSYLKKPSKIDKQANTNNYKLCEFQKNKAIKYFSKGNTTGDLESIMIECEVPHIICAKHEIAFPTPTETAAGNTTMKCSFPLVKAIGQTWVMGAAGTTVVTSSTTASNETTCNVVADDQLNIECATSRCDADSNINEVLKACPANVTTPIEGDNTASALESKFEWWVWLLIGVGVVVLLCLAGLVVFLVIRFSSAWVDKMKAAQKDVKNLERDYFG